MQSILGAKSSMSIVSRLGSLMRHASSTLVEGNISLMHSYAYRIAVIGDIEGSWEKLRRFCELSSILKIESSVGDVELKIVGDSNKVVFLGDAIDKGPNNIQILKALIRLKKKYEDRVVIILGNRDINKLRFNWELSDDALSFRIGKNAPNKFRIAEWEGLFEKFSKDEALCRVDGVFTEYKHGKNLESDRVLKLKFLLRFCMGSPNAFEDMKSELGGVPDKEVCAHYRKMVAPGGILAHYLQLGVLAYIDEATNSLFIHGGISVDSLGAIPGRSPSLYERFAGKAPENESAEEALRNRKNALEREGTFDLRNWVSSLNGWGKERILSGINRKVTDALPIIEYQEPKVVRDQSKRTVWGGPNASSVIQGRPWSPEYNLSPVDDFTKKHLAANGISKVFFGHSPIGQVPVIMCEPFPKIALAEKGVVGPASEGAEFVTVACDTSQTDPKPRLGAVEVSKYGVSVQSLYYDKASDDLIPISASSWDRNCSYASRARSATPVDGEASQVPIWKCGVAPDGRVLVATYHQADFGGKKQMFGLPEYSWADATKL